MNIVDKTIRLIRDDKTYESEPGVRPMVQQLGIKCQESEEWVEHIVTIFTEFSGDFGLIAGSFLALGYVIREMELRGNK